MAELQIRLDIDPTTRKKNITISYRSDEDALPMEHEEEHKRLVNDLIEGGLVKASEVGEVVVVWNQICALCAPGNRPARGTPTRRTRSCSHLHARGTP